MGQIIRGKPVADKISEDLAREIIKIKQKGIYPKLAIMRVGAKDEDIAYERGALNRAKKLGIKTDVRELPIDVTEEKFIKELEALNEDKNIHGILILRPLPGHLNEDIIKEKILPWKDIDCFNPINEAKLLRGDKTGFTPCTAMAVVEMLKYYGVDIQGKNVVVLGRSMVVGKPVMLLLLNENATVTICHSKTKNIDRISKKADILVAAIGRKKFVGQDYLGSNAVVIDVGINVDEEGNLCGDVDFEIAVEKVSMITPVPGGVGSVTTSILAKHLVKACKIQNQIKLD